MKTSPVVPVGAFAWACATVLSVGCALPPPTREDIAEERSEQRSAAMPAHCDPREHYRNALEELGRIQTAAARAIANCEKACADAMSDRDRACASMPHRQLACLRESHVQSDTCTAACRASGVPDDPDISPDAFNPPDPARVTATRGCLAVLGAMRAAQACSSQPQTNNIVVGYRTIRGVEMNLTCYADGRAEARRVAPVVVPWPDHWYLPRHF